MDTAVPPAAAPPALAPRAAPPSAAPFAPPFAPAASVIATAVAPALPTPAPARAVPAAELPAGFAGLLAAEAAAYALPGTGIEAADLEQEVWLRLLELDVPPADAAGWLRSAVRAEALGFEVRRRCEGPYADQDGGPAPGSAPAARTVEEQVIAADARHALAAALGALPGRCPQLVRVLMSRSDLTYWEISRELGISQGSVGPLRSRCLGCLRSILNSRVGSPVGRGNAR